MLSKLNKKILLEFAINFITPLGAALLFRFSYAQTILIIAGSFIIDLDHVLYYLAKYHTYSGMIKFFRHEFRLHRPHLYIFHTFQFLSIALILSYLTHNSIYYLFLGFLINFVIDIFTYLKIYKSYKPWLPYFFGRTSKSLEEAIL